MRNPREITAIALKAATDERLDAYVNRPLASLVVRMAIRTPITANQLTMACAVVGMCSGWLLSRGSVWGSLAGALLVFLAMVLDCSDGQLARARGTGGGTIGRIMDGYGDFVVAFSQHLGMLLFLQSLDDPIFGIHLTGTQKFFLMLGAGLSMQVHCALFDFYKHRFLSFTGQDRRGAVETPEFYLQELAKAQGWVEKAAIGAFVFYQRAQELFVPAGDRAPEVRPSLSRVQQAEYARVNTPLVRAWSFIGPTMHHVAIMACGIASIWDHHAFYWYIFLSGVVMNGYMAALLVWQRIANRTCTAVSTADAGEG